ncbi:MAG: hypothetical protein ACTSYC_06990 [Promethearchaeota archaeon]
MLEEVRSLKQMLEEARDLKRVKEQHDEIVKLARDISQGMVRVKVKLDDPRIAVFETSYEKDKSGKKKGIANLRNVLDIVISLDLHLDKLYDYIQEHVFKKLKISKTISGDSVKVILFGIDISKGEKGTNYITIQENQFDLRTTTIGNLFDIMGYDTDLPYDVISVVIDPDNKVKSNQRRFTTWGVYDALASLYTSLKRVFDIGRIFNGRGNAEFFFGTTEGAEVMTDVFEDIIDPAKNEMKSHLQKIEKGQLVYDKEKIKKLLKGWFKSCVSNEFMDKLFEKFGGTEENKEDFNNRLYLDKNSYFDQRYGNILDEIFADEEKRDQFIIDFEKYLDEFLILQLLTTLKLNKNLHPQDIKNQLIEQLKNILNDPKDPLIKEFNEKAANGVLLQQFFHYYAQIFEEHSQTLFPKYSDFSNILQGASGERDVMAKYAILILFYAYYKSGFDKEFLKSMKFFHSIQFLSHADNMEEFIKLLDNGVSEFNDLKALKNNGLKIPEPRELESMRVFPDIFVSYSEYMESCKTQLSFNVNEVKTYSSALKPSEIDKTIAQLTGGTVDVRMFLTLKKYEESGYKDLHVTAREHVFSPLNDNGIEMVKNAQWKLRKRNFVSPSKKKMGELNEFFIEKFANGLNDLILMYINAENKKSLSEIKKFLKKIHTAIINKNYEGTPNEIYVKELKKSFYQAVVAAYSDKKGHFKLLEEDPEFLKVALQFFVDNFDTLLQENPDSANGVPKFFYEETFRTHVRAGDQLPLEEILDNLADENFYLFTIDKDDLKKQSLIKVKQEFIKDPGRYLFVHDNDGNNGIMKVDLLTKVGDQDGHPLVYDGFKDDDGTVIKGVYFRDGDDYLLSRIGFEFWSSFLGMARGTILHIINSSSSMKMRDSPSMNLTVRTSLPRLSLMMNSFRADERCSDMKILMFFYIFLSKEGIKKLGREKIFHI